MPELSRAFAEALAPLLSDLAREVGGSPLHALRADGPATTIDAGGVRVPARYEVHWHRFHVVPTDLVRDIAYLARRAQRIPGEDEADWRLFAEVFVRDHLLSHD